MYTDVRHPTTGKLLFRYDPQRQLVQVAERGESVTIDLTEYQAALPLAIGGFAGGTTQLMEVAERRRGPIR